MASRKKILLIFAVILLFLVLYTVNFTKLQSIGDEKREIDDDLFDFPDLTSHHSNFAKYFKDLDFLLNSSTELNSTTSYPLSLVSNTFSFIGEWNSNTPNQSFLGVFEKNKGKIVLTLKKVGYLRWRLSQRIIDGYYYDDYTAEVTMEFEADNVRLLNNSLLIIQNVKTKLQISKFTDTILAESECGNSSIQMRLYEKKVLFIDLDFETPEYKMSVFAHLAHDLKDYTRKAILYAIFATFICVLHFIAAIQMIKEITDHESQGNKFSLITLGWISVWDCYLSLFHFYIAVNKDSLFHYFVTPSFAYFTLYTVFETRLIILVWKARYYPGYQFSDMLRSNLFRFYYKFYIIMIALMFLAYKYIVENFFMTILNFYFVPQIIHNIIKGQQIIPNYFYFYSLLASRSLLPLYFRGCPHNLMEFEPSYVSTLMIVVIVLSQLAVLHLQDLFGNRFFIPSCFYPHKYNYFMDVPDEIELESTTQMELMDECAICMNSLQQESTIAFDYVSKMNTSPFIRRLMLKKKAIMRAPCDHKFHNPCLIEWMSIKMECPTCRKPLPPL